MRRLLVPLLALAACAAAAANAPAARAPVSVGVGLKEFRISLYRPVVKPGKLKLNLNTRGEDVHDVVVRRAGRTVASSRALRAGARGTLRVTLRKPGRYELVCLIADHAKRGMRAVLRVRR